VNDELAEELLSTIMGWDQEQLAEHGQNLQALARVKYDEYEGFGPGERFLESLARFLFQFDSIEIRRLAVLFVLNQLVFISRSELDHLIGLVYPDIIRPLIRSRVAMELGIPPHRVVRITGHSAFRELQRKTLVLGLADGARLDRLRRASPQLSHEQFYLSADISGQVGEDMCTELEKALTRLQLPGPASFRQVLLVDDFYGSGFTLIRQGEQAQWKGKLIDAQRNLVRLQDAGTLAKDCTVTIVVYVASQLAQDYVREQLAARGLDWDLRVVQTIGHDSRVSGADLVSLCEDFWDDVLTDEHKGRAPLGFRGVGLPLVLFHNTPNDSISILWADTSQVENSMHRQALFPRYERHSPARP
jgi:hypothetical protein